MRLKKRYNPVVNRPETDAVAYPEAVRSLTETDELLSAEDVLRCLVLRDGVAHRAAEGQLTEEEAEDVLTADESLEDLASRLAALDIIAKRRRLLAPPPEAWWWYPERWPSRPHSHEGLWKTLILLLVAAIASFLTDLGRRLNFDGVGLAGALALFLPALLAALTAGSVLSESFRSVFTEIYDRLRVPAGQRSFRTLCCTAVVFAVVAAIWLSRPVFARWYNDSGMVAYADGRLSDAEASLQRSVRFDPSYALAHYNLGALYEEWLRVDRAKASYQLAFAAGDIRAANNLGRLHLLDGKPAEAAQVLERARKKAGDIDAEARYDILKNLGWARLEQERSNEARDSLEEAVDLRPDEAAAHCLLAKLHTAQGKMDRAAPNWEACLKADSTKIEEDRWRGEAKAALKRLDEAKENDS